MSEAPARTAGPLPPLTGAALRRVLGDDDHRRIAGEMARFA